ncbi:response regulator receiver sensor signal transduction histidine kinase [Solidesulfovibrio fructosivorans JJ]]|uniref:histidine kinase n=1 Tax=Solidesulfovibrio fructosivorans JJ] TaxID=596151 RepID=E1K0H3_SOLFR|nr:hybrid sensor histidine kinase/response regulator [Solidesulfovibrio fructosivorans]EFL49916.1 response regulator receiver sensor signal transduction histidine kinase [Solidesulfovibrio fructosivorans JJ]]
MSDTDKRPSVLIVDDVPANIRVLAESLRDGHDIRVAARGVDALDLARRLPPDIILLDVVMPDMDGYEVCRRLKADPATAGIPIIFVTAKFAPEDEAYGLSLGAVDYIAKPASPAVVRARVKNHLELRAAREELARQNAALTEAAKLREDVDRIMRHDLKAPLTGIIGLPPLILDEGNLSDTQAMFVRLIEESGLKMLSMINQSLDLFKMERGTYALRPEPMDAAAVVRRLFAEAAGVAGDKHNVLTLTVAGSPDDGKTPAMLTAERLLFHTMLANCLKNALEASPENGVVTVALRPGDPAEIAVTNQGVVPADMRERFFAKYATSGKMDGTGLGTYSTRLIAEAHGGGVRMETSDATGTTTVTILLPQGECARGETL